MTQDQKKSVRMMLSGLLIVLGLSFFIDHAWHSKRHGNAGAERDAQARNASLRTRNAASLLQLSMVSPLTVEEKRLFDHAGDDPARMRQALIDIQESRLADAKTDLRDAEERRRQLQGPTGYRVYGDQPAPQDLAELVNEDERSATSRITRFTSAVAQIKAWQPVGSKGSEQGQTNVDSRQSALAPYPPQPLPLPRKPDPRIPLQLGSDGLSTPQTASVAAPIYPGAIAEDSAPSTSVVVYADGAPAKVPAAAGKSATSEAPGAEDDHADQEIRQALQQWAAAMLLNNPHAEAAGYASHMDRYFLRRNVDKAFVEADKANYLRRGNWTAGFTLRDLSIEKESDTTAAVRLVKDVSWQRGPEGETHQLIRSLLHLQHFEDGWKITGEQDFR